MGKFLHLLSFWAWGGAVKSRTDWGAHPVPLLLPAAQRSQTRWKAPLDSLTARPTHGQAGCGCARGPRSGSGGGTNEASGGVLKSPLLSRATKALRTDTHALTPAWGWDKVTWQRAEPQASADRGPLKLCCRVGEEGASCEGQGPREGHRSRLDRWGPSQLQPLTGAASLAPRWGKCGAR